MTFNLDALAYVYASLVKCELRKLEEIHPVELRDKVETLLNENNE